ncbi:hypothetical protein O9K51_02344 [Purpureocillium lavendulum]|uniref:Uncharacterized protein n=1 Tax=Purpureocillium lavendulum TaxID=1247861 RepID=A0AB34FX21_9HYPO|nr:hypothetical protein O9K51_02344 [Purpureocillium lavendulum]
MNEMPGLNLKSPMDHRSMRLAGRTAKNLKRKATGGPELCLDVVKSGKLGFEAEEEGSHGTQAHQGPACVSTDEEQRLALAIRSAEAGRGSGLAKLAKLAWAWKLDLPQGTPNDDALGELKRPLSCLLCGVYLSSTDGEQQPPIHFGSSLFEADAGHVEYPTLSSVAPHQGEPKGGAAVRWMSLCPPRDKAGN